MNLLLTSRTRDATTWTNPANFGGAMPYSGTGYTNLGTQNYRLEMNWLSVPAYAVANVPYLLLTVSFSGTEYRGYISNDAKVGRTSFVIPVDDQDTTPNLVLKLANPSSNFVPLDKTFEVEVMDHTGVVLSLATDDIVAVHFTVCPKPTSQPLLAQSV